MFGWMREREHERILIDTETRLHAMYERMMATQVRVFEQSVRLVQYGAPEPQAAAIADREPDAELTVRMAVREDTIRRGVTELRRAYQAVGIVMSDDELRAEAESMVQGVSPAPRPELSGMGEMAVAD